MATVTVVRYKRRKRLGDDKSPMMYLLKPKAGESKIYSIDSLAQEIESIGSLSVEDVSHVMKSFVRAMKKVLVAGNKVKVDGLGIFYTTLTCPGVEQEKDCTVKNITRINLRFKVDNSLRLANDSTATTRGGDNNMMFELYTEKKSAAGGNGGDGSDDGGKGDGGEPGGMGAGDVKLSFVLGVWLGFKASIVCLMLAFVFGGIIGVLLLASGIKQRKDPIPFGPFLCIGAYIALLFSPYLIYFYWNLFV